LSCFFKNSGLCNFGSSPDHTSLGSSQITDFALTVLAKETKSCHHDCFKSPSDVTGPNLKIDFFCNYWLDHLCHVITKIRNWISHGSLGDLIAPINYQIKERTEEKMFDRCWFLDTILLLKKCKFSRKFSTRTCTACINYSYETRMRERKVSFKMHYENVSEKEPIFANEGSTKRALHG
jgi:hypothetical protein